MKEESKSNIIEEIEIPIDTWLFLVIPLYIDKTHKTLSGFETDVEPNSAPNLLWVVRRHH